MNMMYYGSGFGGADPSQYGGAGQGYGGYSPYSMGGSPMGYGYGGFGGYSPFGYGGGYGGGGGGMYGYGGSYGGYGGGGGMWGGQQAPQQFDFAAMMQPYLDSYFKQLSTNPTTAPTTGTTADTTADTTVAAAPAAPAVDRTFNSVMRGGGGQYETTGAGSNFGAGFLKTGQFGAKGLEAIKGMGYADQAAYLAANSGMDARKNVYDRQHPVATQPNSMGATVQNGKAMGKPSPQML